MLPLILNLTTTWGRIKPNRHPALQPVPIPVPVDKQPRR